MIQDLPRDCYPLVIEFYHPTTRAIVHSVLVEAPAPGERTEVYIPPLALELGHRVGTRIIFADGSVKEQP